MSLPEPLMEDLGHRARMLEPSPAEIARITGRVNAGRAPRARVRARLVPAAALVVLLAGAMAALPVTRTALANALGGFFGSLLPDHPVHGRVLLGRQVPVWLRSEADRAIVISGAGDNALIAYRERGQYCFALGSGVGVCDDGSAWASNLAEHVVYLEGPAGQIGKPETLYGLTRGDVLSVRMTFTGHRPITIPTPNGGFALMAQRRWSARRLELLGARGAVIGSVSVAARMGGY